MHGGPAPGRAASPSCLLPVSRGLSPPAGSQVRSEQGPALHFQGGEHRNCEGLVPGASCASSSRPGQKGRLCLTAKSEEASLRWMAVKT